MSATPLAPTAEASTVKVVPTLGTGTVIDHVVLVPPGVPSFAWFTTRPAP